MRLLIAAALALPTGLGMSAPAALAQPAAATAALRFSPPVGVPLRYRIEASRDWRGTDVPPITGTTRYEIELRFAPQRSDGGHRMTWRLLSVVQQGTGPAGAGSAPGAPDTASAVAEELKAQPVEIDLFASGAVRGLANWTDVAAAFDRAAARLVAAAPPAAPAPAGRRAAPGGERQPAPGPASALDQLGASAAADLLLRDLAPLLGWGGLPVGGAPTIDFARLRLDGLGGGAIAQRERSITRQPGDALEARAALRPAAGALADAVRTANRTAPQREPAAENARPPGEIRQLAQAELSETVRATLEAATGMPVEGVITRITRAPGLFDQTETVTVTRVP